METIAVYDHLGWEEHNMMDAPLPHRGGLHFSVRVQDDKSIVYLPSAAFDL